MLKLDPAQEKKVMLALFGALLLLIVYRMSTAEKPKTAPLAFPPGSTARSSVREGVIASAPGADPLNIIIAKREEKFPGVSRDIFRMENPAPKPKPVPVPVVVAPPPPAIPEKTPEEIAAEQARAELLRFRYLGYLTERDNTLFLSKDGELFMVKAGNKVLKTYRVKEANKDAAILQDTATGVEVRIDLSGGGDSGQQPMQQPMPRR